MTECVLIELIALPAEQSRGRHNPRVVKRKMSGFPTKARAAKESHHSQDNHSKRYNLAHARSNCRGSLSVTSNPPRNSS